MLADLDGSSCPGIVHWQHPSFFAYFPSNTSYPSILGELLTAGLGVQGMSWVTSPACTELETLMLDWMVELLGLPERFRSDSRRGGVIQGSASEARSSAILAARWRATGGAVNPDGDTSRLVAYATSQAHSSIEKGLRIAGIGTDRMRTVAHDESFAMRPDALAAAIDADRAAGLVPFFVCATHGTTSSMAFDPTPAIAADLPRCRRVAARRRGDERDRRPGAGAPLGQRRARARRQLLHQPAQVDGRQLRLRPVLDGRPGGPARGAEHPARVPALGGRRGGAAIDYRDWQVPLGRRFRALKLWLTIRLDGVEAIQAMIRRHVELTQRLAAEVASRRPLRDRRPAPAQPAVPAPGRRRRRDRRADRASQRHRRGAVHPHRARRPQRLRFSIGTVDRSGDPRRGGLQDCCTPGCSAGLALSSSERAAAQEVDEHVCGGAPDRLVVELEEVQQAVGRRRPHRSERYVSGRTSSASGSQSTRSTSGLAGASGAGREAGDDGHDVAAADDGAEVVELAERRDGAGRGRPPRGPRAAPPRPASRRGRSARPGS